MPDISNELVIKASQGDISAFEKIYRDTSGFVYNVAFRITGNRDNADEVTQDVFVKVYDNLRNFGFRSSFKTWIYRITANLAINYCKSRTRYEHNKVEYDPVVHDVQVRNDTRSELDRRDSEKKINSLLKLLDPDQRACIVLREIEGLDYQSIADTLHVNINTVRSRLKRAREKLLEAGREE